VRLAPDATRAPEDTPETQTGAALHEPRPAPVETLAGAILRGSRYFSSRSQLATMNHDPNENGAPMILQPRHDHDWPHRRIALGSAVWLPEHVESLRRVGITHVLDCQHSGAGEAFFRGSSIVHFHCPTEDDGQPKAWEWFLRGVQFARQVLGDPSAKLLVHCAAGVNRSPAMTYAVMRAVLGMPAGKAWKAIERARPKAKARYMLDADRAVARGL
jgi:protein-tyrosine phosphatase